VQFVGQSQGLIHDMPTVQALVDRCMAEAQVTAEPEPNPEPFPRPPLSPEVEVLPAA
jgi:hypothetical protein